MFGYLVTQGMGGQKRLMPGIDFFCRWRLSS